MAGKRKAYTKLLCSECKNINYATHKSLQQNRTEGEQKIEIKKFSKHSRKHKVPKKSKK